MGKEAGKWKYPTNPKTLRRCTTCFATYIDEKKVDESFLELLNSLHKSIEETRFAEDPEINDEIMHDINNAIGVSEGWIDIIIMNKLEKRDPKYIGYCDSTKKSLDALRGLIDGEYKREEVDIFGLVKDWAFKTYGERLRFVSGLPEGKRMVNIDPRQLRARVLFNARKNESNYGNGGEVTVSITETHEGNAYEISIVNEIKKRPSEIDNEGIFNGKRLNPEIAEGKGCGLKRARSFTTDMGGKIWGKYMDGDEGENYFGLSFTFPKSSYQPM